MFNFFLSYARRFNKTPNGILLPFFSGPFIVFINFITRLRWFFYLVLLRINGFEFGFFGFRFWLRLLFWFYLRFWFRLRFRLGFWFGFRFRFRLWFRFWFNFCTALW